MKQFWEIENSETKTENIMSLEDKEVLKKTEQSLKYNDNRYEVNIPWNPTKNLFSEKYDMALKRLQSTEKTVKQGFGHKGLYR